MILSIAKMENISHVLVVLLQMVKNMYIIHTQRVLEQHLKELQVINQKVRKVIALHVEEEELTMHVGYFVIK